VTRMAHGGEKLCLNAPPARAVGRRADSRAQVLLDGRASDVVAAVVVEYVEGAKTSAAVFG